jgi:hypothetical protein
LVYTGAEKIHILKLYPYLKAVTKSITIVIPDEAPSAPLWLFGDETEFDLQTFPTAIG